MRDFQAGNSRDVCVFRLQSRNHLAAVVAQVLQIVQFFGIKGGDESAVARQQRQIHRQRFLQRGGQIVVSTQSFQTFGNRGGFAHFGRHGQLQVGNLFQGVANGRQIARAPASQRQPRQSALHVGTFRQTVAHGCPHQRVFHKKLDAVKAFFNRRDIGQRGGQVLTQQPCPRACFGAVDCGKQRPFAFARQTGKQFQVSPRRRVDFHQHARRPAAQGVQAGHLSFLRQIDIVQQRARRARFAFVERAERVQRLNVEKRLQPLFAVVGGKADGGQRG